MTRLRYWCPVGCGKTVYKKYGASTYDELKYVCENCKSQYSKKALLSFKKGKRFEN